MCRLFPETITSTSMLWFGKLEASSITKFSDLANQFMQKFGPTSSWVSEVAEQGPKETLKCFMERFNKICDNNPGYDKHSTYIALQYGLKGAEFIGEFSQNNPTTLDALLQRIYVEIAKQDTISAQEKIHKTREGRDASNRGNPGRSYS